MIQQTPALLIIGPLICACGVSLAGRFKQSWCFPLAAAGLVIASASAITIAGMVIEQGRVLYKLAGWDPPWGIAYDIDGLNGLILPIIAAASLLNLISSRASIEESQGEKAPVFYTLYVLATTGLLGMTATGDAFNLYVLLEISSLSGYALIASGDDRSGLASLNYVFLGTIGASFYLLGVGFLYMSTGTLNMADLAARLPELNGSRTVAAAFGMLLIGVWIKAAFFPLHAWLPTAYTHAPPPASGLLAPLMTKVMIYVMIRFMVTVFSPQAVYRLASLNSLIVWLAALAIIAGAVMALAERDLRRMAVFIIVAEVGYMVGGAWLGNRNGMTGAALHVFNDALMMLCLFMSIGAIIYRRKTASFDGLKDLAAEMPFTMGALVLAGLSIVGAPPACGFFSKWYLLLGALEAGCYQFMFALILSSLIGVVLFFRVFELAFFGDRHGHPAAVIMNEAPWDMIAPLMIAATGLVAAGLANGFIVGRFIEPVLAGAFW